MLANGYIRSRTGFCIGGNCISSWPTSGGEESYWRLSGNNIYNTNNGNVGIRTANPSEELEVNGDIKGNKIIATNEVCIRGDCRNRWPQERGSVCVYANREYSPGSRCSLECWQRFPGGGNMSWESRYIECENDGGWSDPTQLVSNTCYPLC